MNDSLFARERSALAKLRALVKARAAAEGEIATGYQQAADEAEKDAQKGRRRVAVERKKAVDAAAEAYQQKVADLAATYAGRAAAGLKARAAAINNAEDRHKRGTETTTAEYQDRLWTIDSLLEAAEKEADDVHAKLKRVAVAGRKKVDETWELAEPHFARVGVDKTEVQFDPARLPQMTATSDPEGKLESCLEQSEAAVQHLSSALLPKFLSVAGIVALVMLAGAAGAGVGFAAAEVKGAAVGAGAGAVVGGAVLYFLVYTLARRQVRDRGAALGVFLAETARAADRLETKAAEDNLKQRQELRRRARLDRERADDTYKPRLARLDLDKDTSVSAAETEFSDRQERNRADRDLETRAVESGHFAALADLNGRYDAELAAAEKALADRLAAAAAKRDAAFRAAQTAWFEGLAAVGATADQLARAGEAAFPAWDDLPALAPATAVPDGVRFGEYAVDVFALPEGEPMDKRLTPPQRLNRAVPAFLPFPDRAALLIKAKDADRQHAIAALQATMLRFLTGLPPGKVRFTVIDPVGLGENFAAFMNLADFDEQLIGARIWTEADQIEKRLLDLTEHMENVIQKYLRNQYKSIEAYNRAAGEVAEPYRVLVVANFPANFTPDAARRLISIAASGPACGVCTLITVDQRATLPRDFRLADLEQSCLVLTAQAGKFTPADPDLAAFPLTLDLPPGPQAIAALVRRVGAASKDAARVEVPFEFITPSPAEYWTKSAAKGFEVPIGRAGATKRQIFALGKGTAQHALVAGKTGSGKSTLLHALITNFALNYSPTEAELYLIDFKKGVEFQAYAAQRLPHAKVIAIESEREFGLSVLQRLDAELKDRGDRFRNLGVNDLAGYREAAKAPLARILLIVDEFQEFFVEDDKLAQEASLLLDRLVRQGRAFGLHVLLGSQTLGGAYSLARSTIDQMAVRIALQCSDADAQLILSKDNSAARLLSRPGEAIYNDANGLLEGNDPFQVVWLDDAKKDELLSAVRAKAGDAFPPPLVFAGNAAAEIGNNRLLKTHRGPATAWLGEAVAIKDPTAAAFRPQSAANLLLVGGNEEAALSVTAASLVAFAGQLAPDALTVFDGTPDDADHAEYLRGVCAALGMPTASAERYQLQERLAALAATVAERTANPAAEKATKVLIVFGLHRFRELRKSEDDYGFGKKSDKAATPAELFAGVLRDGPQVGVHVLAWCDSLTNLTRGLDRGALKEFGQRVLFQMSAADSSTLIDTPAAARLGRNRALFVQEDLERPEKFRPYARPELKWLRTFAEPALPAAAVAE